MLQILEKYYQNPCDISRALTDLDPMEHVILLKELNNSIATLRQGDLVAHSIYFEDDKKYEHNFWIIRMVANIARGVDQKGNKKIILHYTGSNEKPRIYSASCEILDSKSLHFIPLNVVKDDTELLKTLIHLALRYPAPIMIDNNKYKYSERSSMGDPMDSKQTWKYY